MSGMTSAPSSDGSRRSVSIEDGSERLIPAPPPSPVSMVELGPLSKLPVTSKLSSKSMGPRRATEQTPASLELGRLGDGFGVEASLSDRPPRSSSDPRLGKMRDRRQVKSWSAGTRRREVMQPLRPHNYNSFAPGTHEDDMNSSRTFGGISRDIRPTLPTMAEVRSLSTFVRKLKRIRQVSGVKKPPPQIAAFVNPRSGGQIGQLIMRTLLESLGDESDSKVLVGSVCDLSQPHEPASTIDELAKGVMAGSDIRLIVCGGDGTVTWILTALEQCRALHGKLHHLPVAIVPLGTGNDLARSLGWGPKLRQVSDILNYLKWVMEAVPVTLDQWRCVLRPHETLDVDHKLRSCGSHPQLVTDRDLSNQLLSDIRDALDENPVNFAHGDYPENWRHQLGEVYLGYWQNYFSLGIDAKVARFVDVVRSETTCGRCCFRKGCGKACYAWQAFLHAACGTILTRTIRRMKVTPPDASVDSLDTLSPSLRERRVNGKTGRLRQLMFVNINSYGAGMQIQPDPSRCDRKPSPGDGILEVLGLRNVLSGLGVYAGLMKPAYFCSAQAVAFSLGTGECMQLDGEPWKMECGCDVLVELHRKVTMLRAPNEARWWSHRVVQSFWKEAESAAGSTRSTLAQVVEDDTP